MTWELMTLLVAIAGLVGVGYAYRQRRHAPYEPRPAEKLKGDEGGRNPRQEI